MLGTPGNGPHHEVAERHAGLPLQLLGPRVHVHDLDQDVRPLGRRDRHGVLLRLERQRRQRRRTLLRDLKPPRKPPGEDGEETPIFEESPEEHQIST